MSIASVVSRHFYLTADTLRRITRNQEPGNVSSLTIKPDGDPPRKLQVQMDSPGMLPALTLTSNLGTLLRCSGLKIWARIGASSPSQFLAMSWIECVVWPISLVRCYPIGQLAWGVVVLRFAPSTANALSCWQTCVS
jgi:hypothetical protein